MKIDAKYFSFCKEVGVLTEHFSRETAMQSLIDAVKGTKTVDPKFAELVSGLTLNSQCVSLRACVLYQYSIDVDYVVGGMIRSKKIEDFGYSGAPDSLKVTDYYGKGEYKTLTDYTNIPFPIFNSKNLFTFESMKSAIKGVIENSLPSNCTSYQSKDWDVSAYLVPTLVVVLPYNGDTYELYYNLQNGCYSWQYPNNPVLLKKGDTAKTANVLGKLACIVLTAVVGFVNFTHASRSTLSVLIGLAFLIAQIVIAVKTKKTKGEYRSLVLKTPEKGIASYMGPVFGMAAITIIFFVLTFIF